MGKIISICMLLALFLSLKNSGIKLIANSNSASNIIIVLKEQINLNGIKDIHDKNEKGWYVFNTSQALAKSSQKELISFLENHDLQYQSFHIINAIKVDNAPFSIINELSNFAEVDYIQEDSPIKVPDVRFQNSNDYSRSLGWGLTKMKVNQVWEEYGVKGEGAVVAGQDTGYDWMHPALQDKYKGWNGTSVDHNYHWHDAIHEYNPLHATEDNICGLDVLAPCDDSGHGTHTMGTMVGLAPNEEIGVAPEAKWIACRNMERGWGTPSSYIECFEWFLAPTDLNGNAPDPSKSPDVINNSWACPEIEGCNVDNFNTMKIVVDKLKAAGIVVVVSAGNGGGDGCNTVSTPSAIFESSFSVGASNSGDTLAGFSSKGAVLVDGSMRIKPNVVAPGVNVRSSTLNGNYGISSGTSMAGPHVAGVVALMISANSQLAGQVEQIETILEQTAIPISANVEECSGTHISEIPNNIFGYGRIDAYAAVTAAMNHAFDFNADGSFIYPNPSGGVFQFLVPNFSGETEIVLWDASGRLVLRSHILFNELSGGTLDLSRFANGVYFYHITHEGNTIRGKLLKH